ncbi:hypothetical protein [Micromonospora sp. SH-82]|uniref:hypothetical protein n=1 Tax=Micromonospora sp. SH-82 TaxID=3132938 RepID=UPI003EBAC82B
MSVDQLQVRARLHLPWAGSIVQEQATDLACGHDPHHAQDLERALNDHLAGRRWPHSDALLGFTALVRVSPDERIRERLRPYWEERIELEYKHELQKIRVEQANELTRCWSAVFRGLEDLPVTAHAAWLTSEDFAEVFGRYLTERRGTVPELVSLLREAVRGHNDLGLGPSEYTQAWDAALRSYEERHGLTRENH